MGDDIVAALAGRHKLRIGDSFGPNSKYGYHALRYDFKPASIDPNSPSTLIVGNGNDVTIIPDGEKAQTFKGNKRPCQKEGILIFDPSTGGCTLERLNTTLQVKKSRDNVLHRNIPTISNVSESSIDTSPSYNALSDKKPSKISDAKQRSQASGSASLNTKKPSSNLTGNSSAKQSNSRASVPNGRINILKDDLNLSESDDD